MVDDLVVMMMPMMMMLVEFIKTSVSAARQVYAWTMQIQILK